MTRPILPPLALSVRQPWAWAIIHAGKNIENRNWRESRLLLQRGRIAIHAPKGMTREEYESAFDIIGDMGAQCPLAVDLPRGGIIGSVEVVSVVSASDSQWFCGPQGLVLENPLPHKFVPALGALGYFRWVAAVDAAVVPASWMMHQAEYARDVKIARERLEELRRNPNQLIEGG